MAIYPNHNFLEGTGGYGKTHTKLELSNGQAPNEQFVVSKENEFTPFIYEYGPAGHQTVLLPKGKIVEATKAEYNPTTGRMETAIKMASEGTTRALGVNQHNLYDSRRDVMEGTTATVLGRSYIEVPLFETTDASAAATTAAAMKFGAAYGATDDLQPGDHVVAGKDGNFRKFNDDEVDGDDVRAILGKVWGVSRELPPAGALQYYTGLQGDALKKIMDDMSGYAGTGSDAKPGTPFSNGAWLPEFLKTIGTGEMNGIPFLTDGYFSALQEVPVSLTGALADNENVETVRVQDNATYDAEAGSITVKDGKDESLAIVKLAHQIDPLAGGEVTVQAKIDGGELETFSKRDVRIDMQENGVVLYLQPGVVYTEIAINIGLVVNPTAGIPTEWDHKGSVGAVRILLNQ